MPWLHQTTLDFYLYLVVCRSFYLLHGPCPPYLTPTVHPGDITTEKSIFELACRPCLVLLRRLRLAPCQAPPVILSWVLIVDGLRKKEVRVRKRAEQCTNKLASHAVDEAALTRMSKWIPIPDVGSTLVFSKGVLPALLVLFLSLSFFLAALVRCL